MFAAVWLTGPFPLDDECEFFVSTFYKLKWAVGGTFCDWLTNLYHIEVRPPHNIHNMPDKVGVEEKEFLLSQSLQVYSSLYSLWSTVYSLQSTV